MPSGNAPRKSKQLAGENEIVIRDCASLDDFHQCVAVQQAVWGFDDRDLLPVRLFVVAHKIEGLIQGAFDSSGRMVGFSLAVPALRGSTVYFHSHMLAVLAEYREQGLGRRLKLQQRLEALGRGIRLIEWTFDPLELKNAYFNLERLGAIARRYLPNLYGIGSSPLHRGLPTDRLVAEWWLESPRVVARIKGESILESDISRRIAVPLEIPEARQEDRKALADVQLDLRRQFQEAFSEGLAAVGFEISKTAGTYLLGPWAPAEQGISAIRICV
jgi:predicted GNAT superfamily acetyltransferase